MNFLKSISRLFTTTREQTARVIWVYVKCNRCGERLRGRVDMMNDISVNYGEGGGVTYFTRKILMGDQLCFQQIEVDLTFDHTYRLLDRQIKGGQFIEESEFLAGQEDQA